MPAAPEAPPCAWTDYQVERLGHVIYLPADPDAIEHVRAIGGYRWAIFKAGASTYVRCDLPAGHPLREP